MRTGLLVTVVAGITALTGVGGYAAGELMLPRQPAPSGIASPLASSTLTLPSPTPTLLPPLPDSTDPPLAEKLRYTGRSFDSIPQPGRPVRTLRLDVPRDWSDVIFQGENHEEAKYRIPGDNTFVLRVEMPLDRPGTPPDPKPAEKRAEELRGHRDLDVRDINTDTTRSRIDGTLRRYDELIYAFTDTANRRRMLVMLRWVDGIEISVSGRFADDAGLRAVMERVSQTARIITR